MGSEKLKKRPFEKRQRLFSRDSGTHFYRLFITEDRPSAVMTV